MTEWYLCLTGGPRRMKKIEKLWCLSKKVAICSLIPPARENKGLQLLLFGGNLIWLCPGFQETQVPESIKQNT